MRRPPPFARLTSHAFSLGCGKLRVSRRPPFDITCFPDYGAPLCVGSNGADPQVDLDGLRTSHPSVKEATRRVLVTELRVISVVQTIANVQLCPDGFPPLSFSIHLDWASRAPSVRSLGL